MRVSVASCSHTTAFFLVIARTPLVRQLRSIRGTGLPHAKHGRNVRFREMVPWDRRRIAVAESGIVRRHDLDAGLVGTYPVYSDEAANK